jgi:O-antigen chain-terminating methyltransferase
MRRGTDVNVMMTRVETALARAARARRRATAADGDAAEAGPIYVFPEGDDELGIALLRGPADVQIEFPSGSDRPVVGPVIRFGKRLVRRGLRWYVAPIMEQQSRFNHALLDMVERLRLENERLRAEIETRVDELRPDEKQLDELAPEG